MKPSVNLAVPAVVILCRVCCVHGGVAEGNVRKDPEPHKIFVTITGLCS